MKTLLIPTDFDLKSLNSIPELVEKYYPEDLNIILVHMMQITDDIHELLMLSRRSTEYQDISQAFYDTCTALKQKHRSSIQKISIEFFYGSTVAVFKNFLDANEVDEIVLIRDYDYKLINKNSIKPTLLVTRCGKALVYVGFQGPGQPKGFDLTASLFEQKV